MALLTFRALASAVLLSTSLFNHASAILPSYPLAVRNPYLSTWMPGDQSNNFPNSQAQFWHGQPLHWTILARVDGKTYSLLGAPAAIPNCPLASQSSIKYTSTHTIVDLEAGSVNFALDFFSPVSPRNYIRQSLPFSYFTVIATSKDGVAHDVQVMSGIDSGWTGERVQNLDFGYNSTQTVSAIYMSIPNFVHFTEKNNMATYGHIALAVEQSGSSAATHQSGDKQTIYSGFVQNGKLGGQGQGDSVGVAKDLGKVSSKAAAIFAVGHIRDNAINYLGKAQTSYYRSKYPTALQAIDFFLRDFQAANEESNAFDQEIVQQSSAISSDYSDITSAVVRQIFGALELTIPLDTLDTSNPYVFLKEISSDGNVNTIDVIYPMFPIMNVLDPTWIKMLLAPIAAYLDTGDWPHPYAVHDIGASYPNAIGHNAGNAENILLEADAGFLILFYDYQKLTGDKAFAQTHAKILRQYADYLVNNGLHPISQLDTVDSIPASAGQTNLALVSAIGLNAYAAMTGDQSYSTTAKSFVNKLVTDGLGLDQGRTHFTYNYGNDSSWGTIFNLYSDQLLDLNTFSPQIRQMQCAWYEQHAMPTGYPYASSWPQSNGLWAMWVAPTCGAKIQQQIIADEHRFLTNGKNNLPFPDRFVVSGDKAGEWYGPVGYARPTMGGVFSVLALNGVRINIGSNA